MVQERTQITIDEFWELCQRPAYDDKQLELIHGEVVVMSPSSGRNSRIALMHIGRQISNFVVENDLGHVTGADGGYRLGAETVRVPDVGFIAHERIPDEAFVFYPVAPDLAVEVIWPSESRASVREKTRMYIEAGTQAVWNVYPEDETIDVVRMVDDRLTTITLTTADTLPGGAVLPGFELTIAAVLG